MPRGSCVPRDQSALERGEQYLAYQCYRTLGKIHRSSGGGTYHFGAALAIASPLSQYNQLFWIHCSLANLFFDEDKFDGAHLCIECVKSHTVNDA